MMSMEVIPAIDISNGKCVRLYKGMKGTEKIYYENPIEALDFWISKDASRLHIIDLDGAWGSDLNKTILRKMLNRASNEIRIQVGGGIRNLDTAIDIIDAGADRIILGTLAIISPDKIKELSEKVGSERIMVAIDYKKGKVATHGWTVETEVDPFSFGKKVSDLGAGSIIFSSIEADGTLKGPDLENIEKMVEIVQGCSIYAAGGIKDIEDIKHLEEIGTKGVIIGKAFYEKLIPISVIKAFKYND